ncbi:MAG: hypothetical protein AAGI01_05935 [Myxococcota bacterium]
MPKSLLALMLAAFMLTACERRSTVDSYETMGPSASSPTPRSDFSLNSLRARFGCDTREPVSQPDCAALGKDEGPDTAPMLSVGTLLVGRTWTIDPGIPGVKRTGLVAAGIGELDGAPRLSVRGVNLPSDEASQRALRGLERQLDDALLGRADTLTLYSAKLEGMLRTLPGFNMATMKREGERWVLRDKARTSIQATAGKAWVLRRLADPSKPADAWYISLLVPVTLAPPKPAADADLDTRSMRELLGCAGDPDEADAASCAVLDGFDAGEPPEASDEARTWFGRVRRTMGGAYEGFVAAVVRRSDESVQLAVGEVRPENQEQRKDSMKLAAAVLDGEELAPKNSALAFVTTIGGSERAWETARAVGSSVTITRKGVFHDQQGMTLNVYARQKNDRLFLIAQDPLSGVTWFGELGLIP